MDKKKIWWRISRAVIFLYLLFVLWGQYSLLDSIFPTLPIGIGIIALAAVLTHFLLKWCASWKLNLDEKTPDRKEIIRLAAVVFFVSFAVLMLFYYAQFPGMFCADSVYSLNDSIMGCYTDWHPALYIILSYTVPMKIGGAGLIVPIQIFWYSIILSYMVCSLRYYRCPKKLCIFILIYLMLMPDTTYILIYPIKDTAFAIMTMLLFTELLHVIKTDGKWLGKKYNMVFLVVNLVITTIVRHNGILFTLPMLVAVLYFSRKDIKCCAIVIVAAVALFFVIKVPIYRLLNVGKPEHRSAELVGLCIDMMGNAMLDSPEFMGEEALDFLCTIQDSDVWNEKYTLGDWNAVKWTDSERTFETIDNAGVSDVLRYTADTVIRCPDQCLKAAFAVTGMVWQIDGKRYWQNVYRNIWTIHSAGAYEAMDSVVREYLRKYDIELPAGEYISQIHDQYTDIIQSSFLQYIFCYVGLLNLILLLVLFSRQEDIGQAFLFTLPVILYSYGTMFLLATYDCRFFYYTYACFFTIMFLLLGKEKTDMLVILDSEC